MYEARGGGILSPHFLGERFHKRDAQSPRAQSVSLKGGRVKIAGDSGCGDDIGRGLWNDSAARFRPDQRNFELQHGGKDRFVAKNFRQLRRSG